MLNRKVTKWSRLVVCVLLAVLMVCTLGLAVFAKETTTEEKSALAKWWESYNQYIGYGVAAVLAVVIVIVIYWWIPKNPKKKDVSKKKKELPKKS